MFRHILLLAPVFVTLFWGVVLYFFDKRKYFPKVFLGHFMAVCFLLYVSHLFYFLPQPHVYRFLDPFYLLASLLVYPIYHIYVRLLTVDNGFDLSNHGKFFIAPFIVFLLSLAGHLFMSYDKGIEYITGVLPGLIPAHGVHLYLKRVYQISRIVFILQVFIFLYRNFVLIRLHNSQLHNFYSNPDENSLHWVQFFNISLSATSLASIIAAVLGREAFLGSLWHLAAASVGFSVMLFTLGLLGSRQVAVVTGKPESHDFLHEIFEDNLYLSLKINMEHLFEKERIFLNPELKIWDLATMLGTNRSYVSRTINKAYNRNFCSHVNHYRVNHAKLLLEEDPKLTNYQVADMSGFGSVNSLYRAFNAQEGFSLKELKAGAE